MLVVNDQYHRHGRSPCSAGKCETVAVHTPRPCRKSVARPVAAGPLSCARRYGASSFKPSRVKARIPRGVGDGEKLRVPGKGGQGRNGGPPGDLYLDIEVAPHPVFRVSGKDLYMDLPLAPWEAVLGTDVQLPTPAGTVRLTVRPGTRAGQQLRLGGRGMARGSGAPGDLYALVRIEVPTVVDDRQRALWRDLAESANFDPRAHLRDEGQP